MKIRQEADMRWLRVFPFALGLEVVLSLCPTPVVAQWQANGVLLCASAFTQNAPAIVPDGVGGVIVVWRDYRNGTNPDIYAQRLDAAGVRRWAVNGVAVCTATAMKTEPRIIADGNGGAIVTWGDSRSGNYDIYVQRLDSTGEPQWSSNGVVLCTDQNHQSPTGIVSDGAGGTIVAWDDNRTSISIYAQRVDVAGVPLWVENGVPVRAGGSIRHSSIASDGVGGMLIAWSDNRSGGFYEWDIYVQRVNGSGALQWGENGVPVCTVASTQDYPSVVSDGGGGAFVSWAEYRRSATTAEFDDVYGQHVSATGIPQWTNDGVLLYYSGPSESIGTPYVIFGLTAIPDDASGAILTWTTYDYYFVGLRSHLARLNSAGPQWSAVSIPGGEIHSPRLAPDGANGAIATYVKTAGYGQPYTSDIYAQRVSASGSVQWAYVGVPLCTAEGNQEGPVIAADGVGGAFIAWNDARPGIRAQRVEASGLVVAPAQNQPPTCDAGGPYAATCQGVITSIPLDGTGSSDADPGDVISYHWSSDCPGATFDDPTSATPTLSVSTSSPGNISCNITLTVGDGRPDGAESCEVGVGIECAGPPRLDVAWGDPEGPIRSLASVAGTDGVAIGSVRPLAWRLGASGTTPIMPPIRVTLELLDETDPGRTQAVTLLESGAPLVEGIHGDHWIVPLMPFRSARLRLAVSDDAGHTGQVETEPFTVKTLDECREGSTVVGAIHRFQGNTIVGPGSGSIRYGCSLTVPGPLATSIYPDGTYRFTAEGHECRVCTGAFSNFDEVVQLYLQRNDGYIEAWWTAKRPEGSNDCNAQYVGIDLDHLIGIPVSQLSIRPSVVVERPARGVAQDLVPEGQAAIVLINGWTESSGAWGTLTQSLQSGDRSVWELYYPSFQVRAALAGRLVSRGLSFLNQALLLPRPVNVVAHSFGAMATRAYIQDLDGDEEPYRRDIQKIVFLNGVNHGSHIANRVLQSSGSSVLSTFLKCSDRSDPMLGDMGVGSDFQSGINLHDLPDLTLGAPRYLEYLSMASTRVQCWAAGSGFWESTLADGPVSVASASLRDRDVPLLVDGSYDHSENQNSPGPEVANAIKLFFDAGPATLESTLGHQLIETLNQNAEGMGSVYLGADYGGAPQGVDPLSWEGGASFEVHDGLENLPDDKAQKRAYVISARRYPSEQYTGLRLIRGRLERYRDANGSHNNRFYVWGWRAVKNRYDDWRDGKEIKLGPLVTHCGPDRLVPSDEDLTAPPGVYSICVNGDCQYQVNVKPAEFQWEGLLAQRTVSFYAASPVDLIVTDPAGNDLGPEIGQSEDRVYDHYRDSNGVEHTFARLPLIEGAYHVEVVRSPDAGPGATYSLEMIENGVTHMLVENGLVELIPSEGLNVSALLPPPAPSGLAAQIGVASVALSWEVVNNPRVASYRIYYGTVGSEGEFGGHQAVEGASPIEVPADRTSFHLSCLPDSAFRFVVSAVDHDGRQSEWSAEVTARPRRVGGTLDMEPNTLNLQSLGRWITAVLELQPGFSAASVVGTSVLLNGSVHPGSLSHGDADADGTPDLTLKFPRTAVEAVLSAGQQVPVWLTGQLLGCPDTISCTVLDTIRVIRPTVNAPQAGSSLASGTWVDIRWDPPLGYNVDSVTVLCSTDPEDDWTILARGIPDMGSFRWLTPTDPAESCYVAVVAHEGRQILGTGYGGPFTLSGAVAVEVGNGGPSAFALYPGTPNPTNTACDISFDLPRESRVKLCVFDVHGREVCRLLDEVRSAGRHVVHWDAAHSPDGVYFFRMEARGFRGTQRLVLIR